MVRQKNRGFTLIELLIAITILAILAAGVFAAIDPVEQFNRAKEAGWKQWVSDISNGIESYVTNIVATSGDVTTIIPGNVTADSSVLAGGGTLAQNAAPAATSVVQNLINSSDLKTNFSTMVGNSNINSILVYHDGANKKVYACYKPVSKQTKSSANLYTLVNNGTVAKATSPVTTFAAGTTVGVTGSITLAAAVGGWPAGTYTCANATGIIGTGLSLTSRDMCVSCQVYQYQ